MFRGGGDSLTCFFRISRIYQDSTNVRFQFVWKGPGRSRFVGPKKIQNYSNTFHSFSKTLFGLIGCTYALRFWGVQISLCFKIFKSPQFIKIPPSQISVFNERRGIIQLFLDHRNKKNKIELMLHLLMSNMFSKLGKFE